MADIDLKYKPRPCQAEIHELMAGHRFGVLVCHRRMGKTVFAVMSLIISSIQDTSGDGRYAYIAPLYRQARQVAWDYFKTYMHMIPGVKFYESDLTIEMPNGARISLYGADNPDSLRGIYLDGVVMDEVAQMRAGVWGEVVRPALADRGGWGLFIGTPKGVDTFYELYQRALKTPGWFARVYSVEDTGIISEAELMSAKMDMSQRQYRQEFLCEFDAGTDETLIPVSLAVSASQRTVQVDFKKSVKVLGVDVARYGDDKSVIFPVAGLQAYTPMVYSGLNNIELAGKVIEAINEFKPDYVRIDAGRGEGVIDYLRSMRYRVTEVNFGASPQSDYYANSRAEMWHGIRKWMDRGGCIPAIPQLINELSAPTYKFGLSNRMTIESKEQLRKRGLSSPDMADALALAVGLELRKPFDWQRKAMATGNDVIAESDYNELG
jgi:hypothetical protein